MTASEVAAVMLALVLCIAMFMSLVMLFMLFLKSVFDWNPFGTRRQYSRKDREEGSDKCSD